MGLETAETAEAGMHSPQERRTLMEALSRRYCWDSEPARAEAEMPRVILRTLNVGTWDDILDLERVVGRTMLKDVVSTSAIGALTPRAWTFWHYRLGLADVDHPPGSRPSRRLA